ncbi:MAG: lipopolysaccharide heptosyltransferase II [Oleiphilaceae bacterium]|nr:lipopolysaccharide heptosyltransferase II [Oleiphilaceae bacterium]
MQQILVIGPSWVGDMVMAQSLFKALRQRDPDCQIDVLAPAWSQPIINAMPEVRAAIDMPVGHGVFGFGERRRIGHALRATGYDRAIVLPNSWKSALIPWFAKIPQRTAWVGESRYGLVNDIRKLDKRVFSLMVHKYVGLAYPKGTTPDQFDIPNPQLEPEAQHVTEAMAAFKLDTERPILALCPGAEFGRAKKWPERHYAEVARRFIALGGQVWLFGSAKDQPGSEEIAAGLPAEHVKVLAGNTSLQQAVALMSLAQAVVANDSGLMHVAAALGRPLVAVFGSTSPDYTPPLSDNSRVIKAQIECSPCFKRECPFGHYKCLEEMAPEQVWQGLATLQVLPQ